jgi:mono/diheme cytochrome c family protein
MMCHGELGEGASLMGVKTGSDIMHPVRDFSEWVVRNGLPGSGYKGPMERWEQAVLSDSDLELIFDYLDTPPQSTTGQGLFTDYCANCHGADGKGGPTTRDLTGDEALSLLEDRVRNGSHVTEYDNRIEFMPVFDPSVLSDAEMLLIRDYVDQNL